VVDAASQHRHPGPALEKVWQQKVGPSVKPFLWIIKACLASHNSSRSYLDIPHLLSKSDEEEEALPPAERQRRRQERQRREAARRQAALQAALAGQGVVGAVPVGFDPTPYQQHLQQVAAQQQWQQLVQHQQQEAAAQQPDYSQQQQQQQQQFGTFGQQGPPA
jgi:hypothetical protein